MIETFAIIISVLLLILILILFGIVVCKAEEMLYKEEINDKEVSIDTVGDLIKELSKYDMNKKVCIMNKYGYSSSISKILDCEYTCYKNNPPSKRDILVLTDNTHDKNGEMGI